MPARDATAGNVTFAAHHVQIRPDRPYSPVAITQPEDGVWVIDFGQNMAGILQTLVTCPVGPTTISYYFGESLKADGTVLNQYDYPYPLIMTANYTCAGTGDVETYSTQFSQYGFRFVQVRGFPAGQVPDEDSFTAYFIHSEVGQTGAFSSDNEALNVIQHMTRYASLSNLMDVPTDCPQRERRGWLGDAQLSCQTVIHNFDAAAFYTKWLRDVKDSQDVYIATRKGQVPDCAPFYGHGGLPADPAWSAAYPMITSWMADYMDDDRVVATHYSGIKAYVDSEIAQLDANGTLSWARYGDWCSVADGFGTPASFMRTDIGTFYFIQSVTILADFAARLNNTVDAAKYGQLASTTRTIYNARFFDPTAPTGPIYSDGYPVSQVLALIGGFVPSQYTAGVLSTLVSLIHSGVHSGYPDAPTGGIVFQKYAHDALTANGRIDLALTLLLHTGFPGILQWTNQSVPATTLWENWQSTSTAPAGSYNHIMYGGYGGWLYWGVAGLGRASGSRGWSTLSIAPPSPLLAGLGGVTQASASVDTAIGSVSVSWDARPDGCACAQSSCACGVLPEQAIANLTCIGGTFSGVTFASFGTPTGTCPSFTVDPACNAASSVALVATACVGKSSCSFPVNATFFGVDPCPNVVKHLSVALAGSCQAAVYALQAVVPANAAASIAVPLVGVTPSSTSLTLLEGGQAVWANGAFVPGVAGVTAGTAAADGTAIELTTGGGSYSFTVTQ